MEVVLIVPTYNPGDLWLDWLEAVSSQDISLSEVYVIDSGSTDSTVKLAEKYGCKCEVIDKADFGHGVTRQFAAQKFPNADILIYLTQDAVLACKNSLTELVKVFESADVGAAYGRQLPRKDASIIEGHARLFNYPDVSHIRTFEMKDEFGIKTAFASNSFSAYRVAALKQVGGFPQHTIISEDMYVTAKMLKAGWHVAYCAESKVYHSHNYTVIDEFKRYFDIGVFHAMEKWMLDEFGKPEGEGARYIKSELLYISENRMIHLFPEFIVRNILKYLGYKLGKNYVLIPMCLILRFSMHTWWWKLDIES